MSDQASRLAIALAIAAACGVLAACSSGSGGTDVTIGSGQNQDPVTLDFPVFYVQRPVPDPDDNMVMDDARELRKFEIGADLFMRDRASVSAPPVNITASVTEGLGDIRGHFHGRRRFDQIAVSRIVSVAHPRSSRCMSSATAAACSRMSGTAMISQ